MNASTVLEDMLFQFLKQSLSPADVRDLHCRADILSHVDEETEDEMKTELYNTFIRTVNATRLIQALRDSMEGLESDDEEEQDESETED